MSMIYLDTTCPYSYNKTICDLFEGVVAKYPGRPAIYLPDRVITYDQFNREVNKYGNYLQHLGVKSDVIVGVALERSYAMLIAIFAILKAGGVYLPVDPEYPLERKQQIITDSKIRYLIVDSVSSSESFVGIDYCISMQDVTITQANISNVVREISPHDLAYIIYTSGSTGTPKGVMIEHHALVNRIEWMQQLFPISEGDVLLQKTHCSFDVSIWEIFWWSITGAGVVLLPPGQESNVILFSKIIKNYSISAIHFVPSVFRIFLDYIAEEFDLSKLKTLKYIFCSGESLNENLVKRFLAIYEGKSAPQLVNLYGPTEATIDVSYHICSESDIGELVPIGKPINNIKLMVLNEELELQPIGYPGDLYIAGAGVARGYLNNNELTDKVFIPNPYELDKVMYRTGDYAKWNQNGELCFLGRQDDQIKLRGLRVELGDIEHHLRQYPAVNDAAVLYIKDENNEQRLVAFIIANNCDLEDHQQQLYNFIAARLPRYMLPNSFVFLDKFPLKVNGKLNKAAFSALVTI